MLILTFICKLAAVKHLKIKDMYIELIQSEFQIGSPIKIELKGEPI